VFRLEGTSIIEAILGVRDERIGPAVADVDRLVDEGVGLAAGSATTRTARSRMSRSCRATPGA
jgi:hypothetical protein